MRLFIRVVGTWLIGLALILLVVDGTKSLAANAVEFTTLADAWSAWHAGSLAGLREFLASRFFADLLGGALSLLLTYPAFAVIGVPGIILALVGRAPRQEHFQRHDRI